MILRLYKMIGLISLFVSVCFLVSCDSVSKSPSGVGFSKGEVIRDLRPLVPSETTDLREMAYTLPILEARDEYSMSWSYEMSEAAPTQPRWDLPADGAQAPVTIIRLPRHQNGAQQIEVQMHPIPTHTPYQVSYFGRLRRIEGGWVVTKAWKTK